MDKEFEYVKEFTNIYKKYEKNKYLREVMCTLHMHKTHRSKIEVDDFYVSTFPSPSIGFGSRQSGFIYYANKGKLAKLIENTSEENKGELEALINFWEQEDDISTLREKYPEEIKELMPSDDYISDYCTSYPLYRLGGAYLDFNKLLTLGIGGLIEKINGNKQYINNDFLKASVEGLKGLTELIELYSNDALDLYKKTNKNSYYEIYETLKNIKNAPPSNMREAIQLMWIYIGVSEVRNYGRLDDLLISLKGNKESDYICINEYFKVIQQRNTIFNGRIIIGGEGRKYGTDADYICLLCLDVMLNNNFTEPQLTLRIYKETTEVVINKAFECIKAGKSYPLLYNDDINIKNVMESFNVDFDTACDYVPFGCGEYIINHKTIGSPNGIINLVKLLEGVLNKGKCIITNNNITQNYIDNIITFEELLDCYQKEVKRQIKLLAQQQSFEYRYMNKRCGYIFNSILYDNCIERGKSLLNGGIDGLGGTLETYGNINAAESLYAIKKLVFDEKIISLSKMRECLINNFKDSEDIREKCLSVEKYGNDNDDVDNFINEENQFIAKYTKSLAKQYDMSTYLVVIINNSANSQLGYRTGASFDGRRKGEALANAITPQAGGEKSGITAVLNTVAKQSTRNMAGAVYNLKLSGDMIKNHYESVKKLIEIFFNKGGSQIMISVMNKGELEDAMINPNKYPNLIVRVGGFSARFIDLDKIIQKEIVSRSMY